MCFLCVCLFFLFFLGGGGLTVRHYVFNTVYKQGQMQDFCVGGLICITEEVGVISL